VPKEGYYLVIALGFLLCLIMVPLSFFVLNWSVWIFITGTLIFFALGVFFPSAEEEAKADGTAKYQYQGP